MDRIEDTSTGIINDYYVLIGERGDDYFCHKTLFSFKPSLGLLGDIRTYSDGSTSFASNDINCQSNGIDRIYCRYVKGFVSQVKSLCHPVKSHSFNVELDKIGKLISWRKSGKVNIELKCDREIKFPDQLDLCLKPTIHVWEVSHLDSSLILSFSAESKSGNGVFKFPSSVHMKNNLFRCDGKPQFTELFDLKSLNSTGIPFEHETMPMEKLDDQQEDHFSDNDVRNRSRGSWQDSLRNWSPSLISIIILVVILIILFCVCRK